MKTKLPRLFAPIHHLASQYVLPCALGLLLLPLFPAGAQTATLGVTNDASGVTLFWPLAGADSTLQWTPSLDSPAWNSFPATPSLSGDANNLLVLLDPSFQATNPFAFFRLAFTAAPVLGPPTVATTPDYFTCNLNKIMDGTVQPNGLDTTWWFQWSQVGNPDTATASDVVGESSTSPVAVELVLTGLSPATLYHYQLYASNADGKASGGDNVFATAPLPGAITLGATNVTSSSALLQGIANPEGSPNGLAGHFQWGLTTSYGSNTPSFFDAAPNYIDAPESYSLTGLQPNTNYHYRMVVFNCSGGTNGADAQFNTSAAPPPLPAVVTLGATAIGTNCATLNATLNPNGTLAGYDFNLGTNTGYGTYTGTSTASGSSPVAVYATLCGLLPGTPYHYRIEAGNGNGASLGYDTNFTTLGIGCQLPSVLTQPVTNPASTSATLAANVNPNGSDTHLYFLWGTSFTNYPYASLPADQGSGTMTFSATNGVTNLVSSTTYYYQAVASNSCGAAYGGVVTFTTGARRPPDVTTLGATRNTATSELLQALVNPNGLDTFSYFQWGLTTNYGSIAGGTGNGSNTTTLGIGALANFPPPTQCTTNHYRIVAYNSAGTNYGADRTFSPACAPITLTCPGNITTNASCGNQSVPVSYTVSASGGCGSLNLTYHPASGSSFPVGTTTVTATATDACGNSTNCSFTVTVLPYSCPPITLTCPANITTATGDCSAQDTSVAYSAASASGGCGSLNLTYSPTSHDFSLGETTVNVTATDACGNTAHGSFTVTVNRPTCPPITLTCPANITTATGDCSAQDTSVAYSAASASGGCGSLNLTYSPTSHDFSLGETTVNVTATDACGNTAHGSFTVTVNRPTCPPITLTCPANITTATGDCSAQDTSVAYSAASASGGCGSLNLTYSPTSHDFSLGETTVNVTATDACGNTAHGSFTVTVNRPTCPPITLTCPANITAATGDCSAQDTSVAYSAASASGGCGSLNLTYSPTSHDFSLGETTVNVTATDACGNTAHGSFTVTVNKPAGCP